MSPSRRLCAAVRDSSFEAVAGVQARAVAVEIGQRRSRWFIGVDEPRIRCAHRATRVVAIGIEINEEAVSLSFVEPATVARHVDGGVSIVDFDVFEHDPVSSKE